MSIPFYKGTTRQRGYGLGGTLQNYGRQAIPYLTKTITSHVLGEVLNGINDTVSKPSNVKNFIKRRGNNVLNKISTQLLKDIEKATINSGDIDYGTQSGSGRRKRRHKSHKHNSKKRHLDIFD